MVTGSVNAVLAGNIRFLMEDAAGSRLDIEATVDTAFAGFLTLPKHQILVLALRYLHYRFAVLGDGTTSLMNVYEALVIWDGQKKTIEVMESETFPLVGMSMLAGYQLRINVVPGGAVEIEPLP